MHLKIDNYTDFELNINKTNKKETDPIDRWCEVSLKIENEYFKYKTNNSEILIESDIEYLIKEFDKLLRGKIKEDEYIDFIEPDLEFILRPAKQIYEEETIDIRINLFQNGALSADFYNLCIGRQEIEQILIYLNEIMPTIKLKKIKKKDINKDSYCIVSVKYCNYDGDKTYDYILAKNIDKANIGDKGLVDRAGNEVLAKIVSKEFYNKNNARYPIDMTKEVIEIVRDDINEEKEKLPKCPNCNSELVEILYGFPIGEAFRQAEMKKLYLGGCCILEGNEQPIYHCYTCNRNYFKDFKTYIEPKNFYEKIDIPENIIDDGENE